MKKMMIVLVGLLLCLFVIPANSETPEKSYKNIKNFCEKKYTDIEKQKTCIDKQFSSYIQILKICDRFVYIKGRNCKEMQIVKKSLLKHGADFNKPAGGDRWINTDWEMTLIDALKELNKLNKKEN